MIKKLPVPASNETVTQSATALLAATFEFLKKNNIPKSNVLECVRQTYDNHGSRGSVTTYRNSVRAYEAMGILMSTWFSAPRFLDDQSKTVSLTLKKGPNSISTLIRVAKAPISTHDAISFFQRSPSVKVESGIVTALRREFVLPNFEVTRAALVIERYLDTLSKNSSKKNRKTILLLERNCHVPMVDLKTIAPVLRDIKGRGSAFIHSINGDIEGKRARFTRNGDIGEMSVHVFAWTRSARSRKTRTHV